MLPRVLLIGDSIRMGYAPLVRQKLEGVAEILEIPENGGDSENVLTHLKEWLEQAPNLDIVHFNCGLHDLKRAFGSTERQQSLPHYHSHLEEIIRALAALTDARLIWAASTPVLDERHHATKGFDRFESDVLAYNAAARRIMDEQDIPINDLHAVIEADSVEACLVADGVHMTERGNALLADAVVKALRAFL